MKRQHEYEIVPYNTDYEFDAANLLANFWKIDPHKSRAYLRWKYIDNPYAIEPPMAFVAFRKGRMVGFRGYFASKWHFLKKHFEVFILSPGDTFVSPEHRQRGLSLKIARTATTSFRGKYHFLLNLSATKPSVPGYLRLGFAPIAPKIYWNRCGAQGLLRMAANTLHKSQAEKTISFGTFGEIVVSDTPWADSMAKLAATSNFEEDRLSLSKNKAFFKWRFANTKNKYVFYYKEKYDAVSAYIVLRLTSGGRRAYLIDFEALTEKDLSDLLAVVVDQWRADILSVYDYSIVGQWRRLFAQFGFQEGGLLAMIEKKTRGNYPLLVKPVAENPTETDWKVADRDIRNIGNWSIKEICSDGV